MKVIRQLRKRLGLVLLAGALASSGLAAETPVNEIAVSAGAVGMWDYQGDGTDFDAGIEWRLPMEWKGLRPWVGILGTSEDEWLVGGGLMYRHEFNADWRATVGSGPFYYKRGNRSRDLGHSLEFYSFLEITRRITQNADLGVRLGHISNGGLGEWNPGTEIVAFVWTFRI